MKPDIRCSTWIGLDQFDFLIFQIKCLRSTAQDDLFKLSIELRGMINRLTNR